VLSRPQPYPSTGGESGGVSGVDVCGVEVCDDDAQEAPGHLPRYAVQRQA